jgi:hypothetical protein
MRYGNGTSKYQRILGKAENFEKLAQPLGLA